MPEVLHRRNIHTPLQQYTQKRRVLTNEDSGLSRIRVVVSLAGLVGFRVLVEEVVPSVKAAVVAYGAGQEKWVGKEACWLVEGQPYQAAALEYLSDPQLELAEAVCQPCHQKMVQA